METTLDSILDIRLYQHRRGYRFSVDSVLLYAFSEMKRPSRVADLGAGSGVVGLLLAKKYPDASVELIELQEGLCRLAKRNIRLNRLGGRVRAIRADMRDLPQGLGQFDLVASNPPFRRKGAGRLSRGDERALARHELELTLGELVSAAAGLLRHLGRFFVVYHPQRLSELIQELRAAGLEPKRLRFVHGNQGSEARMVLLEAAKGGRVGLKVERPLFLYRQDGSYTDEVARIYGNN